MSNQQVTDGNNPPPNPETNDSGQPEHTQIRWGEEDSALLEMVINAKESTGLTYKQLLSLGAATIEECDSSELQSRIGKVEMLSNNNH